MQRRQRTLIIFLILSASILKLVKIKNRIINIYKHSLQKDKHHHRGWILLSQKKSRRRTRHCRLHSFPAALPSSTTVRFQNAILSIQIVSLPLRGLLLLSNLLNENKSALAWHNYDPTQFRVRISLNERHCCACPRSNALKINQIKILLLLSHTNIVLCVLI